MGKRSTYVDTENSIRAKHERRDLRRRMELAEERLALLEKFLFSPAQQASPDAVAMPRFVDPMEA